LKTPGKKTYYGCIMAVILGIPLSAHKQQKEMNLWQAAPQKS